MARSVVVAVIACYDITAAAVKNLRVATQYVKHGSGDEYNHHPHLVPGIEVERVLPRSRDENYHAEPVEVDYERPEGTVALQAAGPALSYADWDDLLDPTQYSFVGRALNLWTADWIDEHTAISTFTKQFTGYITDVELISPVSVRFVAEPGQVDIDVPVFSEVYDGPTRGELQGQFKQRVFGRIYNCPVVRVTIDSDDSPAWHINGGYAVADNR